MKDIETVLQAWQVSQIVSEQVADMERHSTLVDDLDTRSCFLHSQHFRDSPRNRHQLVAATRV
jgi:hypothetical protein